MPYPLTRLRSFRAQTVIVFGALVVALTVILSGVAGTMLGSQIRLDVGMGLQVLADNSARTLERGLEERSRENLVMANSAPLWKDGLASHNVRQALDRAQAARPDSAWIGVVDANGVVMAATGRLLEGVSVAARPWFQAGLRGEHVGDLHTAKLLATLLPPAANGEPLRFVDFAAPILNDGKVIGVIGVHGSWDWASSIVESLLPANAKSQKILAFVFDAERKLIYAPDGSMSAEQMRVQRLPLQLTMPGAIDGGVGPAAVVRWADGKDYLAAATSVQPTNIHANLGWTVVTRMPVETAFAGARESFRDALLIGLLASLVAVTAAWLAAGMLSDPLSTMAKAAREVERGEGGAFIPVLTGSREVEQLSRALSSMTAQLVRANAQLENRVRERTAELELANIELAKLARHDPLTGLLNRRAFDERLTASLAASRRSGAPVSMLMVDADHFKSINDRFGHDVGDKVLQQLSALLVDRLRETDSVARMGGEEFAILLPDTDDVGALLVANAIVELVAAADFPFVGSVTVSVGAATSTQPPSSPHVLMVSADRALYLAKGAGRNCAKAATIIGEALAA